MTLPAARERAPAPPDPRRTRTNGWFRAVWRWHFFASFLVVPILLLLATTGLIYLFRFQLEPLLHPDLMKVEPSGARPALRRTAVRRRAGVPGLDGRVAGRAPRRPQPDDRLDHHSRRCGSRRVRRPLPAEGAGVGRPGHDALRPGDPAARRADGRAVGRPRHRGGRLLGVRDGADRLLPLRPRVAGPASRPSVRSPGRHAAAPARAGRRRGRRRTAHPAGDRSAVDRILGREGAVLRHRERVVDVEPRPRGTERPGLHPGRVAAAQPPPGRAVGPGRRPGPVRRRRRTASGASPTSTPRSRSRTSRGCATR